MCGVAPCRWQPGILLAPRRRAERAQRCWIEVRRVPRRTVPLPGGAGIVELDVDYLELSSELLVEQRVPVIAVEVKPCAAEEHCLLVRQRYDAPRRGWNAFLYIGRELFPLLR